MPSLLKIYFFLRMRIMKAFKPYCHAYSRFPFLRVMNGRKMTPSLLGTVVATAIDGLLCPDDWGVYKEG